MNLSHWYYSWALDIPCVSVTYFLHICPQFSLGLDENLRRDAESRNNNKLLKTEMS